MTALILQVLSSSIFIAGVWLSDFSFPVKMIVTGGSASIYFFTLYQLTSFLEIQMKAVAELKLWVRILESSLELSRLHPSSTESAREIVLNEVKQANELSTFEEKISPSWHVEFFAVLGVVVLAVATAWLWVLLFRWQHA